MRRAVGFSAGQWLDILRAVFELALGRIHLTSKSPRALLEMAGKRGDPIENSHKTGAVDVVIHRVSWAIAVAAGNVPWRSDCFVQAMAAQRWLNRSGITSELFIGVRKRENAAFEAHAWLRHADITVTGGDFSTFIPLAGPETWNGLNNTSPAHR
ncbi:MULTISPECIES: lasso peptide biosynthesis B2 protein [Falsihalocynthiibacter]|uniref:lasso peptide biosynthesis B2 protein n=1 Tax=Falsihalocynthiibacter TaxID=2854182 RepID=UPI0030029D33